MLVIKVEMWPYGRRDQAYEVGRAYLYNTGSLDSATHGNYGIHIAKTHYFDQARGRGAAEYIDKRGYVQAFPRGHKNLWPLILSALQSCKLRKSKAEPASHGTLPEKDVMPPSR